MSLELVKQPIIWIDDNKELERVCALWSEKPLLALDTEFMRSRTYYPIAGLLQVNDGEQNYLVDPTTIDDFYPLIDILDSEEILKVLHSCSEDLEVFHYAFGCMGKNILDTQIAAAFCGYGVSVGYGNLVNAALNVELPKNETRSDWLQRPLSQSQIHYAAIDVEYLFILAEKLIQQLTTAGRLTWALHDSAKVAENYFANSNPDHSHSRVKSAWKLNPRQLAVLKKLSRWREDRAQEDNVPRSRIVKDAAMFLIAQQMPNHTSLLRKYEGMTERMIRKNGDAIIQLISDMAQLPDAELPEPLPRPLNAEERDRAEALKSLVASIATCIAVPSEILVRKKDYEFMLHALRDGQAALPPSFDSWRKDVIGDQLLDFMQNELVKSNEKNC